MLRLNVIESVKQKKIKKQQKPTVPRLKKTGIECKIHKNRTCGGRDWNNAKKFQNGGNSYWACLKTQRGEASDKNKKDADARCKAVKATGKQCSVTSKATCGSGWKTDKTYKGKGKNYRTCVSKSDASADNKAKADARCKAVKASGQECKVTDKASCGRDWSKDQTFKGYGKNYRTCKRSKRYNNSQDNKSEAEAYCKQISQSGQYCVVKKRSCGIGLTALKKFKGKGINYSACGKSARAEGSEKNKSEADAFCKALNSAAIKFLTCKVDKRSCPSGYKALKKYKGKGVNYSVCVKAK
jgi:hypothetical protein